MDRCYEYMEAIYVDGYKVDVIREHRNLGVVSLWMMRQDTNIKMKIGEMKLNANERTMTKWLDELITENFEMKKFDYECLMQLAFSTGLIE